MVLYSISYCFSPTAGLLSGIPIVPDHIAQKLLRAQTQKEYLPQDETVFSEHLDSLGQILSSCVEEARKASFDEFIERSISKLDLAEAEKKGREQKESFALEIDIDFRIANDGQYEEVKSRVTDSLSEMLKTTKFPPVSVAANSGRICTRGLGGAHGSFCVSIDVTTCAVEIVTDLARDVVNNPLVVGSTVIALFALPYLHHVFTGKPHVSFYKLIQNLLP